LLFYKGTIGFDFTLIALAELFTFFIIVIFIACFDSFITITFFTYYFYDLFLSEDFFLGFFNGADISSSTTLFNGFSSIISSFFICFTTLGNSTYFL
jgi:hypothetical protein